MQDRVAQSMRHLRHIQGALRLETIEAKPVFDGDQLRAIEIEEKNRAKEIIEEFMIAANGVVARYLSSRKFPSICRVVQRPNDGPDCRNCWGKQVQTSGYPGFKSAGRVSCQGKSRGSVAIPRPIARGHQAIGLWRIYCRTS